MRHPNAAKKLGLLLAAALFGGFVSRWHGGGFFSASKALKNFMWAFPFAACTALVWYYNTDHGALWTAAVALLVLLLCMSGKATGHGGGMDDANSPKEPGDGRDPEVLEYLILWIRPLFHGKHSKWYDRLLMAIVGLAAVAGAALAIGWVNPAAGALIATGGVLKAPSYVIGWGFWRKNENDMATMTGEFLTGLFAYAYLALGTLVAMQNV